ncbi:methylase involved in ubiquinone/menaquinone biosynthesis [Halovivax ruber XH-70]|uniref:Methylase involved in ubiquinone/menaquinone biosynthesis n=1 Tax=Halovivax ruber (strain DSM 18193 / JCM 13892 / XH-70) TaxID=797302 RepID=L0I924_HALRX|nr:class I SAM-dependent methyltransferase [Halovivax ruber]AGB16110.1 methylase involved in ubiquinone/menaquinone biosynthesis [Halovivax ruber XH-70]
MGFHTFPVDRADGLRDPGRYRYCSREELLSALPTGTDATVADLGSGTGFYTDDVAPFVGTLYAVDVQQEMHEKYREQGVPENVDLVTAGVDSLPFADDELDGAFSTMTHHEYASEEAFAELARVVRPDGRLVTVDWDADGEGADGPPTDERFSADTAADQLRTAGFSIEAVRERPETFFLVASR